VGERVCHTDLPQIFEFRELGTKKTEGKPVKFMHVSGPFLQFGLDCITRAIKEGFDIKHFIQLTKCIIICN
jgi:hypothetical protein